MSHATTLGVGDAVGTDGQSNGRDSYSDGTQSLNGVNAALPSTDTTPSRRSSGGSRLSVGSRNRVHPHSEEAGDTVMNNENINNNTGNMDAEPELGEGGEGAQGVEGGHTTATTKGKQGNGDATNKLEYTPSFLRGQRSAKQPNIGCCGSWRHHQVATRFRLLRDHAWFRVSIILVIFIAGIQVGIATYPVDPTSTLAHVLDVMDQVVLIIFILEIVVKMLAEGRSPWIYFTDSWNCFDFAIVAVGLMPIGGGSAVTALRLVRLLRVLKLVRALPKLRLLVMGLLQSMSSIAYIGLLLGMLFYLYAVVGVSMFGENDPLNMGTLHIALLTLFRCATLEDWSDIMYTATTGCDNWGYEGRESYCVASIPKPFTGVLYFTSFVVLANMMILNLFIGVITTSMAEAKETLEQEMIAEEAERARQKRVLLGLPPESDADQSDLDEAISTTMNRVLYLLVKSRGKTAKFENAFEAVMKGTANTGSARIIRNRSPRPPMSRTQSEPAASMASLVNKSNASINRSHASINRSHASINKSHASSNNNSRASMASAGKGQRPRRCSSQGAITRANTLDDDDDVEPVQVVDLQRLRGLSFAGAVKK